MAQWKLIAFDEDLSRMIIPDSDSYLANRDLEIIGDLAISGTVDGFDLSATLPKLDYLTVTAATDLDVMRAKVAHLTVTQAVDLDQMELSLAALSAAVTLQGIWDMSGNLYPVSTKAGESWIISAEGNGGAVHFDVDDRVVALIDGASQSNATHWHKLDYTDEVLTVAGRVGTVVLVEADITDLQAYMLPTDIDDLSKLNAVVGESLIIDSDPRLTDDRDPTPHTHTYDVVAPINTPVVAYATGGQANATELVEGSNLVSTVVTDGDSVKLPDIALGKDVHIVNMGAAHLDLFPNANSDVEFHGVNAALSISPKGGLNLRRVDNINWVRV